MSVVLKIKESLSKLLDASNEYSHFSSEFFNHHNTYVIKHFNPLITRLRKLKTKSLNTISLTKIGDLKTEWGKYLKNPDDIKIKKTIVRLGLSMSGLEDELEFRNLIKRQEPQRILLRWLNDYIWRFQILNEDYEFKDDFWLELLEDWFFQLSNSKIQINNLFEKHSLLLDFETYRKEKSEQVYFQAEAEKIFILLENQSINDENLSESILEIASNKFYVKFFPNDSFIDHLLSKYFHYLLEKYLANRSNFDLFKNILHAFTHLRSRKGCERFIKLFKTIEWNINEREKSEIKSFTKNKLGDPRINKSEWQILQESDEGVYKKIRYWFNEQDFNLFFEFAFKDSPDKHGRKECWQRYLYYADDFRIFLPDRYKINQFKKLTEKKDIDLFIEPILNHSSLTSFVLKIDQILIFETVDTGTAAYVYNINSIKNKPSLSENEKILLRFYDTYFGKNISVPIRLRDYFIFTDIVYDAKKDQASFRRSPHWRFSRSNRFWNESVTCMMKELYELTPRNPKTGEEINYA
ncbi:MAG: hypothetical protein KGO93_00225 [Cyanobacteria bacterium REEB446]|nr:hypothetical protein [Cyanobacteria bacterium REEB446]